MSRKAQAPRGQGRIYARGDVYWIQFDVGNRRHRESSHSTRRPDAVALLRKRQAEALAGRPQAEVVKVTLEDLQRAIVADYLRQSRRSSRRLGQLWKHLLLHLGKDTPAARVSPAALDAFVTARLEEGASRATVRLELASLRRAFTLAVRSGALLANETPRAWPALRPSDARRGFFTPDEVARVVAALPLDEGDLVAFLAASGWRVGEALRLQWRDVDQVAGVIRIEQTKSGTPRTLPYAASPALAAIITRRRAVTDAVERTRSMIVGAVFARNGEGIRHFRRSWTTACIAAGLGQEVREPDVLDAAGAVVKRGRLLRKVAHRLVHDLRRSFAREATRAGVPQSVVMGLAGWRTPSVFLRYAIVDEASMSEGLSRMGHAPAAEDEPAAATVTAIRKGGRK